MYSGTGACWNAARDNKKNQIVLIQLAVRNDEELSKFLGFATVANGGERDGFVGFEREEEREERFGVGAAMRDSEEKRRRREKLDWIECGNVYGFNCKILMWHFQIGGSFKPDAF